MTHDGTFHTDAAAAAFALAKAGLPVFPCDGRPKPLAEQRYPDEPRKTPLTPHGFKDATADLDTVANWWRRFPEALPGVPMGVASDLFVADADIDRETGETAGEATLAALGITPANHMYCAPTRSGGWHFIFRWRKGLPGNSVKGLVGVDIRSEGGYVVAWAHEALIAAHEAADLKGPPSALLSALERAKDAGRRSDKGGRGGFKFDHVGCDPFFSAVKAAALANLGAWVPRIFPAADFQPGTGAWRVSSRVLGRGLQEDLSLHPDGIRDFGEEAPMTAIDVVMRWGGAATPLEAADWLCNALGIDPANKGQGARAGALVRAGDNDWPELVPLEGGDLPRLSPDMLGGWLGDYASALATSTETPFEMAACLTLGAASVAAARRVRVRVKPDYFEPCNLWLLPALAPGNRKSAVEKAAARPLRDWEREKAEAMASEIAVSASELEVAKGRSKELKAQAAKAKSDTEARDLARKAAEIESAAPEPPRPPQLWTSDATPENLGVLLSAHGERMAWLSAEGGFFEIVGGRYSKGVPNLDLMLKAHAGDAERVDRIGRAPVYLREPLLTVAMSPQPDLLRGLVAKPGFRGRGLLGRFLYFLPWSPLGWRSLDAEPTPEPAKAAYDSGLRSMLDWPEGYDRSGEPCPHVISLSPGAFEEWLSFAKRFEARMRPGGDFENATDWAGKAPGAAVRVAGVLHAADHSGGAPWMTDVPRETMERAIAFVEVSAAHALAAFRLMAADEGLAAAEQAWAWMRRRHKRSFVARDLWQGLKGSAAFATMADVSLALERLVERGYIAIARDGRGRPGRPASPTITVRPDLSADWD
ncbi:Bifunctional DNA primase/polymerase, N-terminal [Albimonas donghaensis]|uniref:Bifunctional DNA primase/polymerase, N-terminal n=1 Tax=Albimonas donghaensis TaxID=356660 RepID=A0A1H2RPS4_9RHOB|nr:DUF3987 domain-containing protein [Albimonas donghaensis]SDW21160.1 Bifunctional DNA primase/polymerase, N-terminal [Albimonas donghaensis]